MRLSRILNQTRLLVAVPVLALSGLILTAQHANAERVAARFVGEHLTCKEMGADFYSIKLGQCMSCPSSHPNRTIRAASGPKACKRDAYNQYARVVYVKEPKGIPKVFCSGPSVYSPKLKQCVTCPRGYSRTLRRLSHAKACKRRIAASFSRAETVGKRGCPEGSFRYPLGNRCYKCPAGATRNWRLGDPTKVKVCTFRNGKALKDRFEAERNEDAGTRNRVQANMAGFVRESNLPPEGNEDGLANEPGSDLLQKWLNRLRRRMMVKTLDDEAADDSPYTTMVWVIEGGGSIILGYSHGTGFAMHRHGDGSFTCRPVRIHNFVAGLTAGAGLVEAFSLERGSLDDVEGQSNGFSIGLTFITGASWGLEWDSDTGAKSIAWAIGTGEFSVEGTYTHAWVSFTGEEIDCNDMNWYRE